MNNRKDEWDKSYQNKDNFVFFPHEEIIRFFSRHICKRVGLDTLNFIGKENPRVLDLGCGIGRHVIFSHDMKTDAYGIDLSSEAISHAKKWAANRGVDNVDVRILQGDITELPFDDGFFDFMVSHGVLDSMPLEAVKLAIASAARVLQQGGKFYCDLISGDDSWHDKDFCGETVVTNKFENGTIQLYYNEAMIEELFGAYFEIEEMILIRRDMMHSDTYHSRYHVTLTRK